MWIHAERFYPHRAHISRHTITNKGMSGWWSGRVEVPFGRHQHRDATWRASLPHTSLEHGDQKEFEMRWASVGLVLGFSNANEQVEDGKHKVTHDVWRRKFWIWFPFLWFRRFRTLEIVPRILAKFDHFSFHKHAQLTNTNLHSHFDRYYHSGLHHGYELNLLHAQLPP